MIEHLTPQIQLLILLLQVIRLLSPFLHISLQQDSIFVYHFGELLHLFEADFLRFSHQVPIYFVKFFQEGHILNGEVSVVAHYAFDVASDCALHGLYFIFEGGEFSFGEVDI